MELVPTRMCALLVGLPNVNVLSIDDVAGDPLRVHIEGPVEETGVCRVWSVRPGEEPTGGRAGGSPLLRERHPSDLAQTPVAMCRIVVLDDLVDRHGAAHRGAAYRYERPGQPMGHRTDRALPPKSQ